MSPNASAHPRARIHVSSSMALNAPRADARKVDCGEARNIQITDRSTAGSPAARSPKSITAESRLPLTSRFPG